MGVVEVDGKMIVFGLGCLFDADYSWFRGRYRVAIKISLRIGS